jgi:hypothetical protein
VKSRARKPHPGRPRPAASAVPPPAGLLGRALRTGAIPAGAIAGGFAAFVLYDVGVLPQAAAVSTVGALTLLLLLFFGLRGFVAAGSTGRLTAMLLGFAVIWSSATFYPFYRTVNPGAALCTAHLHRGGPAVPLALPAKPGRYTVIVAGHFLPVEAQSNRTATYNIALSANGRPVRVLTGTFSEEWGTQRIGSGRRSSLVPVLHQTTEQLDTIDDTPGGSLLATLTDLSPGVRDSVTLRVYAPSVPPQVWILIGTLVTAGAVLIDSWRPKGDSEGLLATLTVAAFLSIAVFRASAVAAPGFPQLVVAALVGTLGGALVASLVWRITQPVRRYLPARP